MGYHAETIINYDLSTLFNSNYSLRKIFHILTNRNNSLFEEIRRIVFLKMFKKLNISSTYFKNGHLNNFDADEYDFYIAGSDQIWNPYFGLATEFELLGCFPNYKSLSYAASFGVDNIDSISEEQKNFIFKNIKNLKAISVREDAGRKIIYRACGLEASVNIDPTMLISKDQWENLAKKPKFLRLPQKYIIVYFLGELTCDYSKKIAEFAEVNNCDIINLFDRRFTMIDPFEFVYLIKNSECVFTDSFHANVFAIIFHKQFHIFNRIDKEADQNSRFLTLHQKCSIDDIDNINWDKVEKSIEMERNSAIEFLLHNLS